LVSVVLRSGLVDGLLLRQVRLEHQLTHTVMYARIPEAVINR